jgi:hypothetical protein
MAGRAVAAAGNFSAERALNGYAALLLELLRSPQPEQAP